MFIFFQESRAQATSPEEWGQKALNELSGQNASAARDCFLRALAAYETQAPTPHGQISDCARNLGFTATLLGNASEAEYFYLKAVSSQESAATPDPLSKSVSQIGLAQLYQRSGNLAAAETTFRAAIQTLESSSWAGHPQLAVALEGLAILLSGQGSQDQALVFLEKAAKIRETVFGVKHPQVLPALNALALVHMRSGNPQQAESFFRRLLEIQIAQVGPVSSILADTYLNLGWCLDAQKRFADSAKVYRQALAIQEKHLAPDSPLLASTWKNIGMAGFFSGDLTQAEPPFHRALALFGSHNLEESASLWFILGSFSQTRGQLAEAQERYEKALAIRESISGPHALETADVLNNLADVLRQNGDITKAHEYGVRALEIREREWGAGAPATITARENLAAILVGQLQFDRAENLFKKAITDLQSHKGLDDVTAAMILNSLGELYRLNGAYLAAEKACKEALDVVTRQTGSESPQRATCLISYGNALQMNGNYPEAVSAYEKAMGIKERTLGPDHPDIAGILVNLVEVQVSQARYLHVETSIRRAYEIRKKNLGETHIVTARTLLSYGGTEISLGRAYLGRQLIEKGLAILEAKTGSTSLEIAIAGITLGSSYYFDGQIDKARNILENSSRIFGQLRGPPHPEFAHTLRSLAGIYESQGQATAAQELFSRAYDIQMANFGPHHRDTAIIALDYGLWLFKHGHSEKAREYVQQAAHTFEKLLGKTDSWSVQCLLTLGLIDEKQDRFPEALEKLLRSIRTEEWISRQVKEEHLAGEHRQNQQTAAIFFLKALARWRTLAPAQAEPFLPQAFEVMESSRAKVFQQQLQLVSAMQLGGIGADRQDRLKSLNGAIQERRQKISAEKSRPLGKQNQKQLAGIEMELADLVQRKCTLETLIEKEAPTFRAFFGSTTITLETAQKETLQPGELCLAFLIGDEYLYALLIGKNRYEFLAHPLTRAALEKKVRQFRKFLSYESDIEAFKASSFALYQQVLEPFLKKIDFAAIDRLLIVPGGPLTSLPFESIIVSDQGTTFSDLEYLGKKVRISYIPSLAVLHFIRQRAPTTPLPESASASILLFGDPCYSLPQSPGAPATGTTDRGGDSEREHVRDRVSGPALNPGAAATLNALFPEIGLQQSSHETISHLATGTFPPDLPETAPTASRGLLAPLPGSRREVDAIAGFFSSGPGTFSSRLGLEARESFLKDLNTSGALGSFTYLHFAVHGIMGGKMIGLAEPCLALATFGDTEDGFLRMSEIFGLRLNTDMVMLSACQTGLIDSTVNLEPIAGLARAFFFAGTPRLGVTLWSIDDAASGEFMTAFYRELREQGKNPERALQRAREHLLQGRHAHPYYWSPFILLGEPR